jgi:eukaryotic-like serine/threonine-protein kinase
MQIDRYEVKRLLGQGAMGKVYLAIDPKLDRKVAIKVLSTGRGDDEIRRRFRLEARAIAALKHPNIVELYDYSGEDAEDLYLVMEYVPGLSLYHLVNDRGPMSEATALCIGHELALALEHAHEHQVVHRDIKPENILLNSGRIVLTDFGVVKAISPNKALGVRTVHTRTQVLGTPGFMAPEQFSGKNIDARTDIFSLGAVLYNLTTGRLPFDGSSIDDILSQLKKGKFTDPRQHNPLLSGGFCALLAKSMAVKSRDRFVDAAAVRQQILDLLALAGVTEVRQELVSYEKNPAGHGIEQRERNVDVLIRDLKVALKDKDEAQARALIERMQLLAPVDERMRDISGVSFDTQARPIFVNATVRDDHTLIFILGMLAGAILGALLTLVLVAGRLIPERILAALSHLL